MRRVGYSFSPRLCDSVIRQLSLPTWYPRAVLLPYVVTRALLLGAALSAARVLPFNVLYPGYPAVNPTPFEWVNVLSRWDGAWYVGIARDGYSYQAGEQSNIAFWPLLPMLMRLIAAPAGADTVSLYVAGVLLSNLALLVALGLLVALLREPLGQAPAERTALYLLVFPTTFFLSALYPHALFLALVLAALHLGRRRRWWLAGLLAAAAAVARPYGAVAVVPLAWEYLQRVRRGQQRAGLALGSLALAPLALAGWTGYLWSLTGGPAGLAAAAVVWDRYPIPPWAAAQRLLAVARLEWSVAGPNPVVDGGLALLFVPLVVASWRRGIPALAAFGSALLGVLLSASQLLSVSRYLLEVVPAFVVLAQWGSLKLVHRLYLVVGGAAALGLMVGYSLGYAIA
jgi:Mannosyltransferase (PIG-V)